MAAAEREKAGEFSKGREVLLERRAQDPAPPLHPRTRVGALGAGGREGARSSVWLWGVSVQLTPRVAWVLCHQGPVGVTRVTLTLGSGEPRRVCLQAAAKSLPFTHVLLYFNY